MGFVYIGGTQDYPPSYYETGSGPKEMSFERDLKEMLIRHEGMRAHPYKCSAGKLTIGVGRNIEENGISHAEAMFMLQNDIRRCTKEAQTSIPEFDTFSPIRRMVIIDMIFNMGLPRFMKFNRLLSALAKRDWDWAANEMLDSDWAKQVHGRATELALMMRSDRLSS